MGNELDWSAIDKLVPLLGIVDVEAFLYQLRALRDHVYRIRKAEADEAARRAQAGR